MLRACGVTLVVGSAVLVMSSTAFFVMASTTSFRTAASATLLRVLGERERRPACGAEGFSLAFFVLLVLVRVRDDRLPGDACVLAHLLDALLCSHGLGVKSLVLLYRILDELLRCAHARERRRGNSGRGVQSTTFVDKTSESYERHQRPNKRDNPL
jgi:hypothetical protein